MTAAIRRRRMGVSTVFAIAVMVVLVMIVGLALDLNYVVLAGQQLQASADSASLAAAQLVRFDQVAARDAAVAYANANYAASQAVALDRNDSNAADGDVVFGHFNRETQVFTPSTETEEDAPLVVNAAKVVARRDGTSIGGPLALIFGPAFGIDAADVTRDAIAMAGGDTGSGLVVLDDTVQCALEVQGTATTLTVNINVSDPLENVEYAAVQVNSGNAEAICHSGQPTINANAINVTGGSDTNFESQVYFDGEYNYGAGRIRDPLAGIPDPIYDPVLDRRDTAGPVRLNGNGEESQTIDPGYYYHGIQMTNDGATLTMNPGIYILDGEGLDVGGGNIFAEGVLLYIVDTTPAGCCGIPPGSNPESNLELGGNGTIHITPSPLDGPIAYDGGDIYAGLTIFQARDNVNDSQIIGTNLMDLQGTLYFPNNFLHAGGTGDGFGNQLIVSEFEVFGTGEIIINYDGRNPSIANSIFLVE